MPFAIWETTFGLFAGLAAPARAVAASLFVWWQQQMPTGSPPPPPPEEAGDTTWFAYIWEHYLNRPIPLGNFSVSAVSLAEGVGVLLLAFIVSRTLRNLFERRLAARTHIDPGTQYTLLRLTHYAIIAVGVMLAIRFAFGADLTSLAVLFTALSVGIGFGLQFLAGDIASGFVLLFERPLRVGDYISVTGPDSKITEGRVRSINLRATIVMSNDNVAVVVPNSKLVNQNLVNWSYRERRSRLSIPVGVSYDSDVDLVTRTLLSAAEGIDYLLPEPKPSVQLMEFGESSIDFRLLVWTDRPRRHPQIKSQIRYRIWRLFKEAGIEIPYPQRDLRLRSGSLRLNPETASLLVSDGDGNDDAPREHDAQRAAH